MISINRIIGNWNEGRGRLKQAYASLTDNDSMFDEGKRDKLMGRLQIQLGKKEEKRGGVIFGFSIK